MTTKIIVADDHSIVLSGTQMLLESNIPETSVKTAASYSALLSALNSNTFDLLLLDINMPGTKNVTMIKEIKDVAPLMKVVVFSSYDEVVAIEYIKAGADGYINKTSTQEEIVDAVNSVMLHGFFYSRKLSKSVMDQVIGQKREIKPVDTLSKRQRAVFVLLIKGYGNMEISSALNLHMSTISTYKKRIFEKLNVTSLAELVKTYPEKEEPTEY